MHDLHSHFIPPEVLSWIKENQHHIHAQWSMKDGIQNEFLTVNHKWSFELKPAFWDSKLFLEAQNDVHISHSVISPVPQLFLYEFPSEITSELSSVYNNALLQLTKSQPMKISAFATVPLCSPKLAAQTLQTSMSKGLKGAIIGPGCAGKMLSDDFFIPFFEEANKQRAILFIHPLLSEDSRLNKKMMANLIGVPWETTVCGTDLILNGMLEKYTNIKFLFAHGGGFLPYQIGRLDKGYKQWKPVSAHLQAPPSEYLKQCWFDSVLWNPNSIELLKKVTGTDRIVPGSDFPFDLCTWPPEYTDDEGVKMLMS